MDPKKLFLGTFIVMSLFSNKIYPFFWFAKKETIKGSGNLITEQRDVSGFKKIEIQGNFIAKVVQSDKENLSIQADDNIVPLIESKVSNGKLIIKIKDDKFSVDQKINYEINAKNLRTLRIMGSGKIACNKVTSEKFAAKINGKGTFNFDDLTITGSTKCKINGKGTINIKNLITNKFLSTISGSGEIKIENGEVINQEINIAGHGNFYGKNFKSQTSNVYIAGTGTAIVFAKKSLDAKITGIGTIEYAGNPLKTTIISTLGTVKKI